jgi:hypothetical protein
LALLVTDPSQESHQVHAPAVQLTFGPRAEEIIGSPVEELISDDGGFGAFVPTRIASLYGKTLQFTSQRVVHVIAIHKY